MFIILFFVIGVAAAIFEKKPLANEYAVNLAEMVDVKAEPQKSASNVVTLHVKAQRFL
jgi:hypothetical protein